MFDFGEHGIETGQGDGVAANLRDRFSGAEQGVSGRFKFGDVLSREGDQPIVALCHVVAVPHGRTFSATQLALRHR